MSKSQADTPINAKVFLSQIGNDQALVFLIRVAGVA